MNTMRNFWLVFIACLGLFFSLAATPAEPSVLATDVVAENAYINIPLPGKTSTVAYLTLYNKSAKERALIAVRSAVSGRVELHSHTHENGMMKMRREERVVVPANGTLEFKPHSWHLMIFDVQGTLKTGEELHLTLLFSDGSYLPVVAQVRSLFDQPHH